MFPVTSSGAKSCHRKVTRIKKTKSHRYQKKGYEIDDKFSIFHGSDLNLIMPVIR